MKPVVSDSGDDSMADFGFRKVPAQEKARLVLKHFHTVAPRYDWMNTVLSFGLHHVWKRAAVGILGLKQGDWVMDMCGGTGDLSLLAAKAVGADGQVILYDINRMMMDAGRPRLAKSFLAERIYYVQGDAEQISFPDGQFEAAMVGFGIRNLTYMEKGLAEIHRVLKVGGTFLCLEFSQPTAPVFRWLYDLYSFYFMPLAGRIFVGSRAAYTYLPESIRLFPLPDELADMLERIGFSQVTYRRFTNGIAVVHWGMKQ